MNLPPVSVGKRLGWLLLGLCLAPHSVLGQSKESVPVPEYFGIYAVVEGKLVKLDAQQVHTEHTVSVRLGQRNGVGNILQGQSVGGSTTAQIAGFSPNLRIVVFSQPSGLESPLDVAKSLHLESLVFVRNLTVDTGWPNNVRRSGLENGWDSGEAPELLGIASGDRSKQLEFLIRPMAGHQDMVIAELPNALTPGVYRLSVGERDPFFGRGGFLFAVEPVADGENSKCVNALVTYSMNMSNSKYTPCSGNQQTATSSTSNQSAMSSSAQTASAATASGACGDYDGCMRAGQSAFRSEDWQTAVSSFQTAANQRANSSDPWVWLGRTYLRNGQNQDVPAAWDKALQLGGSLIIGACHERAFQPCERGDLSLSSTAVAFLINGSQTAFSVAPSQVSAKGVLNNTAMGHVSFGLQIEKKKYNFEFLPLGVTCQIQLFVQCPQEGTAQQLTVANYISRSIPALASGALGKPSNPATSSASQSPPPGPPSTPGCSQSIDAGYSLLLQGRLYKVRAVGPTGPSQVHIFFDDKNHQVMDADTLQQLAVAAWTRDNVVASSDARGGAQRVSGILGTSKALQNYSNVQDALARGMVEALEAVVTDGASLSKAVPNLTGGILKNQLKSAPKTIFVRAAQIGLEQSLAAYNQMASVPLPPADATVLNTPDLIRIKAYYLQARTLELPYESLAAKLMPTSASQLTNQAFASAISEVIPSVGLSTTDLVTLNSLLTLQKSVANLADTLPALQSYSQNLKLALDLADANNRTISSSALAASSPCGQTSAQTSTAQKPIVGQLMFVTEQQFAVAPFLTYESTHIVPLPTGTNSDSFGAVGQQDLLPSGEVKPTSTIAQNALRASPLKEVRDFTIYRGGTRLGTFSVTDVKVSYFGAMLKAAGFGQPQGFVPNGGEIAVAGPVDRAGSGHPRSLHSRSKPNCEGGRWRCCQKWFLQTEQCHKWWARPSFQGKLMSTSMSLT